MSDSISLASTTDDPSVVRSVVAAGTHKGEDGGEHVNDVLGARAEEDANIQYTQSDDGTTSASYEDPAVIERQQLEEQLQDAQQDLRQPPAEPVQRHPGYDSRLTAIRQANPEALAALESYAGPEPPQEVLNVLATSPAGADLAVWLAHNPEAVEQLNAMPVHQAVMDTVKAIGAIEHNLQTQAAQALAPENFATYEDYVQATAARAVDQRLAQYQQNTQPQPRRSSLRPTKAVGGTIRSTVRPEEMSYTEYRKWHSNEVKAGRLRR